MHDKFKKRFQAPKANDRVRRQIAVEAARRMVEGIAPESDDPRGLLRETSEAEFYTAKRKAAAVLGHRVRPGDLPSDSEVRDEAFSLLRAREGSEPPLEPQPEPAEGEEVAALADHVDRFAIYKLRLQPLEAVKQNVRLHPEGDALYHSLQVFEHARAVRPYDEEFLLAALLHDVGKAIEPTDHVSAGVEALRGAVTERTLWLIAHHMDLFVLREKSLSQRARQEIETSEYAEDLRLLLECDEAGRTPGAPVPTIDEALAIVRALDEEAYLH
jgi:HD domain